MRKDLRVSILGMIDLALKESRRNEGGSDASEAAANLPTIKDSVGRSAENFCA